MSSDQPDIYPSREVTLAAKLRDNIETVIRSNNQSIKWLLTSFFAGGHVLLEDVPGTGKTTLATRLVKELEGLSKNRNIPEALRNTARKMHKQKIESRR